MRVKLLFFALAIASFAHAQQPTGPNETTLWNAYQNLRTSASLDLKMTGTEAYAGKSSPVRAELFWRLAYDSRTGANTFAQAELDIYDANSVGTSPSYRIVGDGVSLYRYDMNRHTVSSTIYGFYGEKTPEGYEVKASPDAHRLLGQLRAATPGPTAHLIHLLTDLNPVGSDFASRYTSWDPGTVAWDFDQVWNATTTTQKVGDGERKKQPGEGIGDTLVDPLTYRHYVRDDPQTTQWFFYRVNQDAPGSTMAVRVVTDPTTGPAIQGWAFTQSRGGRVLDLAFAPAAGNAPAWAYAPYTGTQAAAFRPVAARI